MQEKNWDILITGGTLMTMSAGMEIIEDSIIGIKDGLIVKISQKKDSGSNAFSAKETIDASGCIVMPGLVNTHTHLPMVCFRGMADDLPLMKWLNEHIFPAEARFVNKKMVYDGATLAMAEMILSGTTTFATAISLKTPLQKRLVLPECALLSHRVFLILSCRTSQVLRK